MILLVAVLVGIASVPLTGGHLSHLTELRLRCAPLLIGGFLLQLVAISVLPTMPSAAARALHLASYGAAAVFFVANIRVRWLWLLAVGGAANLAAITANAGVMPASEWATRTAGLHTTSAEFANSRVLHDARLLPLGDIFAIPASWPLANVFSIGDILLVTGAALVLHHTCRRGRSEPGHFPPHDARRVFR